jgi:hypothetical protein
MSLLIFFNYFDLLNRFFTSTVNLKFIHGNALRAVELRISINTMFGEGVAKAIE